VAHPNGAVVPVDEPAVAAARADHLAAKGVVAHAAYGHAAAGYGHAAASYGHAAAGYGHAAAGYGHAATGYGHVAAGYGQVMQAMVMEAMVDL
jgi:hypothetical protein